MRDDQGHQQFYTDRRQNTHIHKVWFLCHIFSLKEFLSRQILRGWVARFVNKSCCGSGFYFLQLRSLKCSKILKSSTTKKPVSCLRRSYWPIFFSQALSVVLFVQLTRNLLTQVWSLWRPFIAKRTSIVCISTLYSIIILHSSGDLWNKRLG